MSLSDTIGDVLGSVVGAGTAALPAILAYQQAQGNSGGLLGSNRIGDAINDILGLGFAPGDEGVDAGGLWRTTPTGYSARSEITSTNPASGRLGVWKYAGRPVLYSGDLATCKRVNRISSRVARVARRRGMGARSFRRRSSR